MLQNNLDAYNDSAKAFDERIGSLTNYDESYLYFSSLLSEGNEVLDTACGPANISRFITKQIKNINFTLIDLSKEMLKVAKQYLPDVNVICHDICDFNLNKQFDAVINGFGLPYLSPEDANRHFETVYSHLKTGGFFYLSFMNINSEKYPDQDFCVQNEHPSFNPGATITVTYHSQKIIEKLLFDMGFELLRKWNLDYKESDGSITTDVVMILKKK